MDFGLTKLFYCSFIFLLDVLFFVATWSLFYMTRLLIKKLTPIYELKLPEKSQLIFEFSRYLAFFDFESRNLIDFLVCLILLLQS